MAMSYKTARRLGEQLRGGGPTPAQSILEEAMYVLLESPQVGRGIPSFDADLIAIATAVKENLK